MDLEYTEIPVVETKLKAGERWRVKGKVLKPNSDELQDLTPYTAKMEFRVESTRQLLTTLTHEEGIKLLNASGDHNYEIDLSSLRSLKFNDVKEVVADLFLFNGETAYPILDVHFEITRSHTTWN
ncbi:hypothetical protein D5018_04000 [Parashewanella curva]|uniref:Uncharacterized protein n=1 Tax=Parashewanella curva TaxID=2338552 RepID=A0A3L8Q345_9GAMM|nr:hypothetical protein [Parashewanella curva]RLV61012.1 hypothetical protein D5018_04000 [Parashewanella curva]